MIAETVGVAERTVAYVEDGHASVSGWAKAACNWSGGETKSNRAVCSTGPRHTGGTDAAHAGFGWASGQLRLLARVFANPRCAGQFPESAELLVGLAGSLWFDEFAVVVRRWEALADTDGAHDAHQRAHADRDAHISISGRRVYLDGCGGVAAGAVITEIFDRFCDSEFHADWDTGVAQWGQRMNPALLERSGAQRRFDALLAIFTTAATASGSAGASDPLVNMHRRPGHLRTPPRHTRRQRCRTARPGHRRRASLRNLHRSPTRPRRPACRRTRRARPPRRARLRRGGHRPRAPLTAVHRLRPATPCCSATDGVLARMRSSLRALPNRSHHTLVNQRAHPTPQRGTRLRPPQPLETTRLPNLARPHGHWHTYRPDGTEIGQLTAA